MILKFHILIYFVLSGVELTNESGSFPYSTCNQVGDKTKCTGISFSDDIQARQSIWPPGPYALPMSKLGCPETRSQGWDRGYLIFNWDIPHSVYTSHETVDKAEISHANLSQFRDVLSNEWPNSQSFIHGPYDAYSWKMNFCIKTRQNGTLDTGHWLPGQYQIYRSDKKCPQGFEDEHRTLKLTGNPKLTRSGYLPDYEFIPDGDVTVKFNMCRKTSMSTNVSEHFDYYGMTETVFAVHQVEGNDCPMFGNMRTVQETLIGTFSSNDKVHIDIIQGYCHFQPNITGVNGTNWLQDNNSNAELMSYVWQTMGIFPTSTNQYPWLQMDFQRTLLVSRIEIKKPGFDMLLNCFHDNAKMSFLHFEATECLVEHFGNHEIMTLQFRNMQARFITLVLRNVTGREEGRLLRAYINDFEISVRDICNTDLGMGDGSIQDFQISASSWLPEFMPSAARPSGYGWCAEQTDETPWIMVDLVAVTRIEGVNIFNWEERVVRRMSTSWNTTRMYTSFVKNKGILAFEVYYGVKIDSLYKENQFTFSLDASLPVTDEQTILFMMPIYARFVKLDILEYLYGVSRCMKFELRGCKMSGLPSLDCTNTTSSMYKVQTSVRPVENHAVEVNASNSTNCKNLCSEMINCSVSSFTRDGTCLHYASSSNNHWQIQKSDNENWAIKICAKDSLEILPPVGNMVNVQSLTSDSPTTQIITSIGYPFTNAAGQMYKWRIDFNRRFISIAFTHVSMRNESTRFQPCYDRLRLSKHLQTDKGKEINSDFNGRTFYIETSDSMLWLTFISCKSSMSRNVGFRAIVTTTGTMGCLQIDSSLPWSSARSELCDKPQMFLTSMSMLNFPYLNIEERWQIHAERWQRIRLQILEFYVVCPSVAGILPSTFRVISYPDENTYCNNNMPPTVLYSNTETLIVVFNRRQDLSHVLRTEGFRIHYETMSNNMSSLTDVKLPAKECLGRKCYSVYSDDSVSWLSAAENCHRTQQTLVSLHSIEEMQYVIRLLQMYSNISGDKWRNMTLDDASAHIGLHRYGEENKLKQDIWDSKEPVTYKAWAVGQPKYQGCTKMSFRSRFSTRTWISEDCSNDTADYYVCEDALTTRDETTGNEIHWEVTNTTKCEIESGWLEAGYISHTVTGIPCQNWNEQSPHSHQFGSYNFTGNTCQDVSQNGYLWCFTTDPDVRTGYCLRSIDDANYVGKMPAEKPDTRCLPGTHAWKIIRCDGKFDCDDQSDEILCEDASKYHHLFVKEDDISTNISAPLNSEVYFQCSNLEWISILSRCDDVIDCLDSSDEHNCTRSLQGCAEDQFKCDDGACVSASRVCDNYPDCFDASDEYCDPKYCFPTVEFRCDNGQCIELSGRCNAISDCFDNSDEKSCRSCKDSFHCDGIRCIPERLVCDNYVDCKDGTDESSCSERKFTSCEELFELGYQNSGQYQLHLYATKVYCDFTAISNEKKMRMILPNTDLVLDTSYLNSTRLSYLSSGNGVNSDVDLAISDDYQCAVEIQLRCTFAQEMAYSTLNLQNDDLPYCGCSVLRFGHKAGIWPCNGSKMFGADDLHANFADDTFASSTVNFHLPLLVGKWETEAVLGRIECIKNYDDMSVRDTVQCDGDMKLIPSSMRCVYGGLDAYGYTTGCRSGSHLANCADFTCPEGTMKCPRSFCLPQEFVCDGEKQCQDGADEQNCYCKNTKREVIILIEDSTESLESATAAINLAHRLYTTKSIIRISKFRPYSPIRASVRLKTRVEHRALEISEELVRPYFKVTNTKDCTYRSYASNFLKHVQFSMSGIKGIVFIEDGEKSSKVASLMFSNIRKRPDFRIYRVKRTGDILSNKYRFVTDIPVRRWNVLSTVGYKYFAGICQAASDVPCRGKYRCSASKQCLPLSKICDGVSQCIHGDDEKFCHFSCPRKCQCKGFYVNCRNSSLRLKNVFRMSKQIRSADFSENSELYDFLNNLELQFAFMHNLNLSKCNISVIQGVSLNYFVNLLTLDISYNSITTLPANGFDKLQNLIQLKLDGNFNLQTIEPSAFDGLTSLKYITITGTKLKRVEAYTFSGLNLDTLDISKNELQEVEGFAFSGMSVKKIIFGGVNIKFNKDIFTGVFDLRVLHTPDFKFCCVRPSYVEERNCYPTKNEISSCEDLMRLSVLQTMLWLVGIASLLGNVGSIVYRLVFDRERLKIGHGIFVTNLAVSDFLMGVYLIIIAVADSIFRNRYIYMDDYWRNSVWCTVAGVLSFVSSETSVIFVCLITIDRLLVIKYPFGQIRFTPKSAYICCVISWSIASALALIPVMDRSYFDNQFYTRSGVCVALPLTRDQPPGWEYSVSIFVGLNFFTFILIAFGQLTIFLAIRKSKSKMGKSTMSRKRDLQVARNLILVASTDFLCWFPIGVMGLMALSGYPVPGDVYAWTVVFILPFNSALNPLLYTVTAIVGRKTFNPSAEEQGEHTITVSEMGSRILKFQDVSRYVNMEHHTVSIETGNQTLEEVLRGDNSKFPVTVVSFARLLARYLDVLHESSVIIDELNVNTVRLSVDKYKICRNVSIDSKTHVTDDVNEIRKNMYEFGVILRKFISEK